MCKIRLNIWISLIVIMLMAVSISAQTADQLLQNGLMKESGEGNLQEAISIYEKIVADENAENSVKAKAQLRIGLCYEKLGKSEAIEAYELVLKKYQNFEDEVHVASLRLSELNKEDSEDLSVIKLFEKGSWLENSSLSPDGTKLVGVEFNPGQNITVYDRSTNKTQMITKYNWTSEPIGITYFPCWSPDGKEIIYMFTDTSGIFELQVSTLEGEVRSLIKNEYNAGQIIPRQWSQDGSSILTFKQDSSGLYTIGIVATESSSFKSLHKTQWKGRFPKGGASLSPDGKFVVFADGDANNLDIFIVDTKGGIPSILFDHPTNEYEPLWSPDGKHIVFIRETKGESMLYGVEMSEGKPVGFPFLIKEGVKNVDLVNWTEQGISYNLTLAIRDIHTVPLNSTTGVPTDKPKPLDFTPIGSNICPVWSHDGKYLAFISYDDKPEVVVLSANSPETRYFTIPAPEFRAASIFDLHWLPDNSGVGFCNVNSMDSSIVYRLDLNTGKWQNWTLPCKGWTRTDWGPDANTFIYNNTDLPKRGLYKFNIETGETQNIFEPKDTTWYTIRGLKFSRDHKKLIFMYQSNPKNYDLMVLNLESGESSIIGQNLGAPTFSPDGQKILALGRSGVSVLSLEGETLQQFNLLKNFALETRIYNTDWSPDGKQLVFSTVKWEMGSYLIKNVLK